MQALPKTSSNLFAIDHDTIRRTLGEANTRLLQRRDSLMAAFARAPASLASADEIARARCFAAQLDETLQQSRTARLADGRPFSDASGTVRKFFEEIDKPLRVALQAMLERLTIAGRQHADQGHANEASPAQAVAIDSTGSPIIIATPAEAAASESAMPLIDMTWVVEGIDRETLDLDALRPYLSDTVLLSACRRHLADHGPNALAGAIYRQMATP